MLKRVGATLLCIVVWGAVLLGGTLYGWWRRPLAPADDAAAFLREATALVGANNRANTALVLIERGTVAGEYFSSTADPVDRDTVFAVASSSKWITAHAVLKLVEQGKLDLDRPVEGLLTRWHLPPSSFGSDGVTARRLLSHTAGLTDGLGFGDYRLDEPVPTLEDSLAAPRFSSGTATGSIAVGIEPGSQLRYSGGGYLLLELLVEEMAGERFESFVRREILEPLGMTRSGYDDLSTTANSAKSYDTRGQPAPIVRYASNAATGFTTSAGDLVKLVLFQLRSGTRGPLTTRTLESMRVAEATSMGVDLWGLGTVLYAPTQDGRSVFGHDGINEPAISATVRINPQTEDALIVLATGSKTLASQIGAEWVFWQTGLPDVLSLPGEVRGVMPVLGIGVFGIVLIAVVALWRTRRGAAVSSSFAESTDGNPRV